MAALTKLTTNINLEMSGDTKRYLVSAKQGDKGRRPDRYRVEGYKLV